MPDEMNGRSPALAVLVLIATIAVIGFNALASAGLVNGVTPATVSARNPSLVTPAGYAFSIWSLIYLGLVTFAIVQVLPARANRFSGIRPLYLATCVLNVAWIWGWHHGLIAVCAVLIAALAAVLIYLVSRIQTQGAVEMLTVRVPFSIYAGWVTCAALVNLNILITRYVESRDVLMGIALCSIMIASALSVIVTWRLGDHVFPIAAAWALTAIGVKQSGNTTIVVAAALGTIACLIAAGSVVTKLKDSTSES